MKGGLLFKETDWLSFNRSARSKYTGREVIVPLNTTFQSLPAGRAVLKLAFLFDLDREGNVNLISLKVPLERDTQASFNQASKWDHIWRK